MAVRAKFKVQRFESMLTSKPKVGTDGRPDYSDPEQVEMRTIVLTPVFANGDPNHENAKFWQASPSGEIRLGTVNPEAWQAFELGRDYYIDFTPAE